jgi:hypothetical protein
MLFSRIKCRATEIGNPATKSAVHVRFDWLSAQTDDDRDDDTVYANHQWPWKQLSAVCLELIKKRQILILGQLGPDNQNFDTIS